VNKHHAVRTWSNLLNMWFASRGECRYGEGLYYRQLAGEISDLKFHTRFTLSKSPRCSIEADFIYTENGETIYEDFKGMGETREYRVKRLWLKEQQQIDIRLVKEAR